jgi:hypothetical protein
MALNPVNQPLITSSLAPSSFEDEVTFTVVVTDPNSGPNAATAPIGTVLFVADGSFGFGSETLLALTASITAVSSTLTTATYVADNSFAAGQIVTIQYMSDSQFNGTGLVIASANGSSFTVNGSYTVVPLTVDDGTATSTNASSCSAATTALLPGVHTVVGQYQGDATPVTGHEAANSQALSQQVTVTVATSAMTLPGFSLIASFSTQGDTSLPPEAVMYAVPASVASHQSVNLLWDTLNVAYVRITGNNFVDYQTPPPPGSAAGFDTGFISTSGSGLYAVGNGFTAGIVLTLQAYDQSQVPIVGVSSSATIVVS